MSSELFEFRGQALTHRRSEIGSTQTPGLERVGSISPRSLCNTPLACRGSAGHGDAVNHDVGRAKATMAEAMLDGHCAARRHPARRQPLSMLPTRRGKAHLVAGYNAVALGHITADIEGIGRNDPQKRLGPDRIGIL